MSHQARLPFKVLNRHLRFALVLIFNSVVPSLGNLIFVGFNIVNLFSAALSFLIWSKHNPLLLSVWTIILGVRAFGDIYLHTNHKQRAGHSKSSTAHQSHNAHADEQFSPLIEHINSHPNYTPRPQTDLNNHSNFSPAAKHTNFQPDSKWKPQDHVESAHLSAAAPKAHKAGWDPKFHLHEEAKPEAGLKPAAPLQMRSGGAEQYSDGAHKSIAHPGDPLYHQPLFHQDESQKQLAGQQESEAQHAHEPVARLSDAHRHLSHAEMPLPLQQPSPASPAETSANTDDAGVIYDLYGEEEEQEDADSSLSPLKDGFFHSTDGTERAGAASPGAIAPAHIEHSCQQIKTADYGLGDELSVPLEHHKKRVELCSNCQRPREHKRPKCPTCGTHFESES